MRYLLSALLLLCSCQPAPTIEQWATHEITLTAEGTFDNPYTDVQVKATFLSNTGDTLTRPAFWDGGSTWKIRFAPPEAGRKWQWHTVASPADAGLTQEGTFKSIPYTSENALLAEGLLRISPGKRNMVHQSGKSFLVVGDTPWALPFRATIEQATIYAEDRQQKGFNAALLMTIQPDMYAEGPDARNTSEGFARGFADLQDGHINEMNPGYFKYLDTLITVLIDHEIVPVYQPVFHGFGWKGLEVLGNHIEPQEYVRYTRYLMARYGSQPALWLIAGDNGGDDPGVKEAGEMLQTEDAYGQPTGLHYNPCDDFVATWAVNNPIKHCMHYNQAHHEKDWLDFQWAQTGHGSEHEYTNVARLYDAQPTKASANGEPTYEGMGDGQEGLGWWQGKEAWMQLMSGGTMGVVYGAASLWQWKITADEPGWPPWASQQKAWHEAMQMEGSTYVGHMGRILDGLDMADIEKRWDLAGGKPLLAREGELYVAYLDTGGELSIADLPEGLRYTWFNPRDGKAVLEGQTAGISLEAPSSEAWVFVAER